MQTRIYVVSNKAPEGHPKSFRLVDATSQAQAIRHVAADEYECHVAQTKELAILMNNGVKIETAGPLTAAASEAPQEPSGAV